ncbi:MAG TPA: kynureninase [Steroidobacteraceae bacterium]|jgi:kynureninase|nr:kynureninase [Steroidobacteraceae bacterium]
MTYEPTLKHARQRDEADPLSGYRQRFALPRDANKQPSLFLCGHSLGLMPIEARTLVNEELDDWSRLAVLGHEHARRPWIPYHENLTAGLTHLTGAQPGEVIAMNSLTVNLHLMLASFFRPNGRRTKILIETGAFSSDRHAVTSQLAWHNLDPAQHLIELTPPPGSDSIPEDAIEACLAKHGADIALLLWPGVQFRTGQAFDLPRIARAGHLVGCVVGFDLAHSIGNMPLALHDYDADFAVWCSYKYLNAGPGAIGGCFVHERHFKDSHLTGWWGHEEKTRFRMDPLFRPANGIAAWQISNPPILAAAPLIASLAIFQDARIERLRAKSIELTGFLEFLVERLGPDARFITPRGVDSRGCQISIRIANSRNESAVPNRSAGSPNDNTGSPAHVAAAPTRGRRVFERLGERGVVCDWRDPDVIRVAPVPLYNTFEEVFRFSEHLAEVLREIP